MGIDDAVVEGISRSVMELFERSIRDSVVAAVRALAPHLVITFPETPDAEAAPAGGDDAPQKVDAVEDEAVTLPGT